MVKKGSSGVGVMLIAGTFILFLTLLPSWAQAQGLGGLCRVGAGASNGVSNALAYGVAGSNGPVTNQILALGPHAAAPVLKGAMAGISQVQAELRYGMRPNPWNFNGSPIDGPSDFFGSNNSNFSIGPGIKGVSTPNNSGSIGGLNPFGGAPECTLCPQVK